MTKNWVLTLGESPHCKNYMLIRLAIRRSELTMTLRLTAALPPATTVVSTRRASKETKSATDVATQPAISANPHFSTHFSFWRYSARTLVYRRVAWRQCRLRPRRRTSTEVPPRHRITNGFQTHLHG